MKAPVVGVVVPAGGALSPQSSALLSAGIADAVAGRVRPVPPGVAPVKAPKKRKVIR